MMSLAELKQRRPYEDSTADHGMPALREVAPLPYLTILAHSDPDRVGARVCMSALLSGGEVALSRATPCFAQPGAAEAESLADRWLSRAPIWIAAGSAPGSLQLERRGSTMAVEIDGVALGERRELAAEEVAAGAVVLLADRVALVLHLGDALAAPASRVDGLIGESQRMARLARGIRRVAPLEVPVLIRGESGAGKELVARAIHEASPRRHKPYVAVNLAAIPPALAAAELFGAARGAFTGAEQERAGYFGRAHGGTLFLDEIGEAAPEVQALLLRALESGEVQMVGGGEPRRVDVRVIAATDADLHARMAADRFRAPLFHRLMAASLQVPPLRARREDLGRLLVSFLRAELAAVGRSDRLRPVSSARRPWLPAALVARLARCQWPGNVRQLRNCARAMVVASREDAEVSLDELSDFLAGCSAALGSVIEPVPRHAETAVGRRRLTREGRPAQARGGYRAAAEVSEAELLEALRKHHWRLTPAASELGIARTSLYALIERCPRVRKASDLSLGEIEQELARAGGDVDAAGEQLGVSRHGLLLRLRELRAALPGS